MEAKSGAITIHEDNPIKVKVLKKKKPKKLIIKKERISTMTTTHPTTVAEGDVIVNLTKLFYLLYRRWAGRK